MDGKCFVEGVGWMENGSEKRVGVSGPIVEWEVELREWEKTKDVI